MSYLETFKKVLMKPADAFAAAKKESGFGNALSYWAISLVLSLVITGASLYFVGSAVSGMLSAMGVALPGQAGALAAGFGVAALVVSAVQSVIALFGVALVAPFAVNALGAKTDFHQTFRMMAYGQVPILPLAAIPLVGLLFALYGIYVFYKGVSATYGFDLSKSVIAMILFIVVGLVVGMVSGLVTAPLSMMMGGY